MMSRTITKKETNQLFDFCRKHYIQYYDLQVELVDHLASVIEEQWQEKPELQFEEALHLSFKKFGIYGFSKIKEQKQKELNRKYNRLLWQFFKEYFKLPKIILTFALTLVLFIVFQIIPQTNWLLMSYSVIFLIAAFFYIIFIYPKIKAEAKPGKSFLLVEQMKRISSTFVMIIQLPQLTYHFFNFSRIYTIESNSILFALSLMMVFIGILLFGQLFFIPKKIKEHFREQFPEFAL